MMMPHIDPGYALWYTCSPCLQVTGEKKKAKAAQTQQSPLAEEGLTGTETHPDQCGK